MKKHSDGCYSMRLGLLALGAIVAGGAIADEGLPTVTITASRMGAAGGLAQADRLIAAAERDRAQQSSSK